MRIAIIHDYLKEYGGAEKVLETLCSIYPEADVYTTVYLPSFLGPHKKKFENVNIHPSRLQYFPFRSKLISPFRLIAPLAFKRFDFSNYDVIMVSQTGAYTPNLIDKKGAVQICYSHTPPRYLYGYATARDWKRNRLMRIFGEIANHFLRMTDFKSAQNVDFFIANSENVKKRIEKFYRKESVVIYPPVKISNKVIKVSAKKEYYLAGGRLARPKHIDLIVKALSEKNLPLKVFGKGFAGYGAELRKIAGRNVEFLGEVTDQEKLNLMVHAKAFIFASEDEDLGIIPIEAMSTGTPVIAYESGGVLETVIDEKTGYFFKKLTVESLISTVERFEKEGGRIKAKDCINQAHKFSEEKFKKEIKRMIEKAI